MTAPFLKGLAFGFVLAAAVGPMWVLCLDERSPTGRSRASPRAWALRLPTASMARSPRSA